jgi:hypothetical protein
VHFALRIASDYNAEGSAVWTDFKVIITCLIMKTFSHIDVEVGGFQFHVSVVASGDREHPYTVEWWRAGDKSKICDTMHFGQVLDAERWAEEQIRKKYG